MLHMTTILCVLTTLAGVLAAMSDSDHVVQDMKDTIRELRQQLRVQQLGQELVVRAAGNSGIVRTRDLLTGTKPYSGSSYTGRSVAAIHNHANEKRTIGMGEVVAVLNGVQFKSRHNDYALSSPSRTSDAYMQQQYIEFPDVPPAVLAFNTTDEQILEMQKWFKAFHQQDHSVRDYRPYFKATLCYLEGGWTNANDTLREPFPSRRHKIRASLYSELTDKFEFESATGAHMPSEDYAYLPRKMLNSDDILHPVFSQWSYRIACHLVHDDLPTARIVPVLDLAKRMADHHNFMEYVSSRTARFNVASLQEHEDEQTTSTPMPRTPRAGLLDELMSQVPGKDNYAAYLNDISLGGPSYGFSAVGLSDAPLLNSALYHRLYSNRRHGSSTMLPLRRSFSDETMFMAMNTRPEITASEVEYCDRHSCRDIAQKWSYAIPLEIVYTNPLTKWNPHGVLDRGSDLTSEGQLVTSNARNGGMQPDTAYDGINDGLYFSTPARFYASDQPDERYPADTGMATYGVLDQSGNVHRMAGAGYRILLPKIHGINGRVRIRYPIGPVHEEGSAVWKEMAAIRDMLIHH